METSGRQKQDLSLDVGVVRTLLCGFLRDECRHAGFSRAVLGLSGGVDSAVVAALSAEAMGKENVKGVLMPYRTSSPQSRADAELVVRQLGIGSEVVDITPMVDAYPAPGAAGDRVRQGNIMARQLLLGYGTLFGDMASALNPLGDLYKTQVWQLAAGLGIPRQIIEKKPSADLWEGQTDEGELGLTYGAVDRLLYAMIDERRSEAELRAMGFQADFIGKVKELIRVNQFKRRPPVIAKVSHRTVNIDFRYPRDWGI
jgi:NAD+ synthase